MESTNCASIFQHHQGSEYLEMNALKKSVEIVFFYTYKRNYKYKIFVKLNYVDTSSQRT